jgi:hypothetical protein
MGLRYPGGLISATPPTVTTSSAKGVWTIQEALQYQKAGTWPVSKYTVIQTFTATQTWTCPTGVTVGSRWWGRWWNRS